MTDNSFNTEGKQTNQKDENQKGKKKGQKKDAVTLVRQESVLGT